MCKADLQKILGCSERTITNKLSGETGFTISEAFRIRDTYFQGLRMEYHKRESKSSN